MTREPVAELHPAISTAGTTATPWRDVLAALERAEIFWISTVRADGRPHVTPLPAMWLDSALHFSTGLHEQKGRNLTRNPNYVLTSGTNAYRQDLDAVVEGRAERVTDRPTLERLAALWPSKIQWPYDIVERRLSSSAGGARRWSYRRRLALGARRFRRHEPRGSVRLRQPSSRTVRAALRFGAQPQRTACQPGVAMSASGRRQLDLRGEIVRR